MKTPSAPPHVNNEQTPPIETSSNSPIQPPPPDYSDESADPPPAYTDLLIGPNVHPAIREQLPGCKEDFKNPKRSLQSNGSNQVVLRHKNVKLKKGLACVGWVFCCPLMVCGICLRESPTDDSDLHDDACLPCYYDNNN